MPSGEIIMGVDPAYVTTGYGIVESRGQKVSYIASGLVKTPKIRDISCICAIFEGLKEICVKHRPRICSIEEVFVARNPRVALKLGHARGAAVCAAAYCGVTVKEYSSRLVKKMVTGNGNASKMQVKYMVARLLRIPEPQSDDESDALAIALCQAFIGAVDSRLKGL